MSELELNAGAEWHQVDRPESDRDLCDCGKHGATWHGPQDGHRQFMCDDCYRQFGKANE